MSMDKSGECRGKWTFEAVDQPSAESALVPGRCEVILAKAIRMRRCRSLYDGRHRMGA